MGTFSRLRYVIAANVNTLLEKAEDPEKLLRALIREMEDAGEEARAASAELLAEQRHLERRAGELDREAGEWQARAERAVADGRDDLARAALKTRTEIEAAGQTVSGELSALDERLAGLEKDTATLKQKLAESKQRLKSLAQRPAGSRPASTRPASPAERRVQRAFGRFDRLQAQVENLEARVQSYETGGPAPAAWTGSTSGQANGFDRPEAADPAVEEELERLKKRLGKPATEGRSGVSSAAAE